MFSSGAPAPPSSVCLERPLSAVFPLSRFPIPLPKLSERGDGTARKEVLKELFLSKKSRMSVWPMPLANRLVPSPPANLWGGKRSGKGEGPLRFLPSPVCLLRYVGLEQEFAGGGTVLEHHGIGHGFEPLHTLRHFGGYGGDGVGKLMIAAGFKDHAGRFTGFVAVRPTGTVRTGERGGEETDFVVGERFHQFDGLGEFVLGGRGTVKGFVDGCWAGDVELYFGQRVQADEAFEQGVCMQTVRPPLASCCTSSTK